MCSSDLHAACGKLKLTRHVPLLAGSWRRLILVRCETRALLANAIRVLRFGFGFHTKNGERGNGWLVGQEGSYVAEEGSGESDMCLYLVVPRRAL